MAERPVDDEFVRELTKHQNQLYAYIVSLTCDPDRAKDVLQQANVVMWRKASSFTPGTSFAAWACRIAYFEVLADRRKARRERLVFDDEVLALMSDAAQEVTKHYDERWEALEECIESLPPTQRRKIVERYCLGGTVKGVAEMFNETPGAVATALYRTRSVLLDCVQRKLSSS